MFPDLLLFFFVYVHMVLVLQDNLNRHEGQGCNSIGKKWKCDDCGKGYSRQVPVNAYIHLT